MDTTTCGFDTATCILPHEIEYDSPTMGKLAWVKVPSVDLGTVIYMFYGKSCHPCMALYHSLGCPTQLETGGG